MMAVKLIGMLNIGQPDSTPLLQVFRVMWQMAQPGIIFAYFAPMRQTQQQLAR